MIVSDNDQVWTINYKQAEESRNTGENTVGHMTHETESPRNKVTSPQGHRNRVVVKRAIFNSLALAPYLSDSAEFSHIQWIYFTVVLKQDLHM